MLGFPLAGDIGLNGCIALVKRVCLREKSVEVPKVVYKYI